MFGQRLRLARREAGLSQSKLEMLSGIPKARLSRYENGHVLPSIGTLGRLAKALGVSEAALLGDQRVIVEQLFEALLARGVVLHSVDQARVLANAVADISGAIGLTVESEDELVGVAADAIEDGMKAPKTDLPGMAPV